MLLELHDHRQANHFKTTMLVLPSASSTSTTYARRLLLHTTPLYNHNQPSNWVAASAPPVGENTNAPNAAGEGGFDANVVMILAVLLCALICALGLNSVVRCALRCSSHMTIDGGPARCASHTGVKKKALRALPTLPYSAGLKLPGSNSECAICLSEFVAGERVRVLPKCNHGFHVKCIDPWLVAHSSCPTCRRCLFNTCQKTSRCAELASPSVPPPVIVPLEREGLVTGYMHAH